MSKRSRLRFTPDETPEKEIPKKKAQKSSLPGKEKMKPKKPVKPEGKPETNAAVKSAGLQEKAAAPTSLHFEENRPKIPSKLLHEAGDAARLEVHEITRRENTDENTAVEAAQRGEELAENALHDGVRVTRQIREHRNNPNRREKNAVESREQQKAVIKKKYARAKTQEVKENKTALETARGYVEKAADTAKRGVEYLRRNPRKAAIVLALFMLLSMLTNIVSSCSLILEGIGSGIAGSTYPSKDSDMLAAEAAYCALEAQLKQKLDNYEHDHDYDKYEFDLDEIKHDPYVLISTITALHGGEWTIGEVQGTLQMLFARQYTLTETLKREMRTDPSNPEAEPKEYVSVKVKLKNNDLSHLQYEIMTQEQLARYSVYMATLGNRPDLFPNSAYIGRYGDNSYLTYDIPPSALEDEVFAAMIKEAEKYLGYPYVWGGSNPSTSFDCSGFVCWVLNHSGWNVGRTTAQGLCNYCTPVRASDARPGDLVFFVGTYDTPEVSHVGIYVGNAMMIQCGDPITYSNLNSSYWQEHLYCYGRLPGRS